jgi:hypothetical protein
MLYQVLVVHNRNIGTYEEALAILKRGSRADFREFLSNAQKASGIGIQKYFPKNVVHPKGSSQSMV